MRYLHLRPLKVCHECLAVERVVGVADCLRNFFPGEYSDVIMTLTFVLNCVIGLGGLLLRDLLSLLTVTLTQGSQ